VASKCIPPHLVDRVVLQLLYFPLPIAGQTGLQQILIGIGIIRSLDYHRIIAAAGINRVGTPGRDSSGADDRLIAITDHGVLHAAVGLGGAGMVSSASLP
jgi:hypothetical protein